MKTNKEFLASGLHFVYVAVIKAVLASCSMLACGNISGQGEAADDTVSTPAITASGKIAGKPVELKMDKEGGSLLSGDGKMELIIPQGALAKKTNISIQPISNMAPNGNGMAYRLEPSGIRFSKPVQLVFHYTEEESADSMQLQLGIAMQDNSGRWLGLRNTVLDTTAKTISGQINHFSDWSKFDAIKLYPSYKRLKVNKQLNMTIDLVSSEEEELAPLMQDDLAPLIKTKIPWTPTWRANEIINGNSSVGTITSNSKTNINYKAPANVPNKNPVAVTADLKGLNYKFKGTVMKDLKLVSNILIYADAYEVILISRIEGSAGSVLGRVTYLDTGSFVVSLEKGTARVIERVNKNASDKLDYKGKCTVTLLNPSSNHGNIHITGVSGIKFTPADPPGRPHPIVEIAFVQAPAKFSVLRLVCPNQSGGTTTTTTAQAMALTSMIPAMPIMVKFTAREGEQVIEEFNTGELFYKVSVRAIKEDEE